MHKCRICILGNVGVGKSSLLFEYTGQSVKKARKRVSFDDDTYDVSFSIVEKLETYNESGNL